MISVLLVTSAEAPAEPLSTDLANTGFHLLGAVPWRNLVREVMERAPDLVVAQEVHPAPDIFASLLALQVAQPMPVLLFSLSPDAEQIEQGLAAGVSAHVVNGYSASRLRPLVHLAIARFRHQQGLRQALADTNERFEERKLVDRAKGVLMRARQMSEDDAFRMLRVASMHTNRRVGQISQQVIAAARFAEAVNRAGQLRMLSQQLLKHAALQILAADANPDAARIAQLLAHGKQTLSALGKSLSQATYGDLLDAVSQPWLQLNEALQRPVPRARLAAVDALAEDVLKQAERLTAQLEHACLAAPLRVINLSGRQRMLSQRLAKQVLLAELLSGEAAAAARREAASIETAFAQALAELGTTPLSSAEIRADLAEADVLWSRMLGALAGVTSVEGRSVLRDSSEALLALFEQLTQRYERSLQMLMG